MPTIVPIKIHPRHMYISNVSFQNNGSEDIMVIDEDFIIPVLGK